MKKYIPDYYKKFQCIAGECKDNCCIGWDIMIDPYSYEKYQKVTTPFKERLEKGICHGEEPQFLMDKEKRCFFLNQKNLCDIYIELGEDALCEICTQHPRFHNEYGHIRQSGLGLACEYAAHLILEESNMNILEEIIEEDDSEIDEWSQELMQIEMKLLKMSEDKEYPIEDRINKIFDVTICCQEQLNLTGELSSNLKRQKIRSHHILEKMSQKDYITYWFEFYADLEYMDESFQKLLNDAKNESQIKFKEHSIYIERLIHYFIYRHFIKSYDDDNLIDKIKFAVLSALIIVQIYQYCVNNHISYTIEDIAKMYSKEFEYSQENIDAIFEELLFD